MPLVITSPVSWTEARDLPLAQPSRGLRSSMLGRQERVPGRGSQRASLVGVQAHPHPGSEGA